MAEYTCGQCGTPFQRYGRPATYCSRACRSAAAGVSVCCAVCSTTFQVPPSIAAKGRRYCSNACRWSVEMAVKSCRVGYADCGWCGQLFVVRPQGKQTYCGRACEIKGRQRTRNAALGTSSDTVERACENCGKVSVLHASKVNNHGKGRFCSHACSGTVIGRKYDDPLEAARVGRRRRRARKAAVPSETYSLAEIAERDGWSCGICGLKVDKAKKRPDPFSASLDHVVPYAEGGNDMKANIQLAHLRCNISKGARTLPQGEQLRLIG